MGKKAKEIIKLNIDELIIQLNKALADEWLAYYQYWVGSKIATGLMKDAVIAELTQHAADELRHADMLATRIMQLGGTPVTNPVDFSKLSNCGYLDPKDPNVKALLTQNVEGERCAIGVYDKLLGFTKDKDIVTYEIILTILKDEIEHEDDLEALLEDLA